MQRWQISRGGRPVLALVMAVATLAVLAPHSPAIVPPRDCGTLTVKAKRYLSTHRRPTGYTCRNFSGETKLKFRCSRGVKVFFAIRR